MKKILSTSIAVLSLALVALFISSDNVQHDHNAFAVQTTQTQNKPLELTKDQLKVDLKVPPNVYAAQLTPVEIKVTDAKSGKPLSHVDWAISVKDPNGNVIYKTTTGHSHAGIMNFNVAFPIAGENTISLTSSSIGPKMMGMDVPAMARTHTMLSGDLMGFEKDPDNNFGSRTYEFPVYVLGQKQLKTIDGSEPGTRINVDLASTSDEIIAGQPATLILSVTNPSGKDPIVTHPDALITVRKGTYIASKSADPVNEMMPMNGAYHGHLGQMTYTTTFPSSGNYLVQVDLNSLPVSNLQFGQAHTRFNILVSEANGDVTPVSTKQQLGKVNILGLEAPFYSPNNITVKRDETITFDNIDGNFHTVTSGSPESGPDGKFDSGLMSTGQKYTLKLDTPGTYSYYCTIHTNMVGTVTVS